MLKTGKGTGSNCPILKIFNGDCVACEEEDEENYDDVDLDEFNHEEDFDEFNHEEDDVNCSCNLCLQPGRSRARHVLPREGQVFTHFGATIKTTRGPDSASSFPAQQ